MLVYHKTVGINMGMHLDKALSLPIRDTNLDSSVCSPALLQFWRTRMPKMLGPKSLIDHIDIPSPILVVLNPKYALWNYIGLGWPMVRTAAMH
ncbi:hypothetical protein VNO77_20433 [Canavalia gladiata]|uniref:Uncharacterized protein n=1 Tax=Canavalia gladiata TaxID=3824 RepID=A0AAN9LPJ9_CANGL